ncbi:MAG: ABC transporter ATP-binding protein [Actinobacteria bacterium]|nr:ABC transporter ATP-binding protein [Actinomycetota bacterium]
MSSKPLGSERDKNVTLSISDAWVKFRIYHDRKFTLKERLVRLGGSSYEDFWALSGVSFNVNKGEMVGIIGHNGSGKSTLLKCIAGVLPVDKGSVKVNGRISPLLELGAGFHPDLSGRENIYLNAAILGLTRKQVKARFDDIVNFAELEEFIDTPVRNYSSGMYVRLGFAIAVHSDPEILLVDEVLAVGDEAFQKKCFEKIEAFKKAGVTIVFVTHDLGSVRRMCDRVITLERGRIKAQGKPGQVIRDYVDAELIDEESSFTEYGTKEVVINKCELLNRRGEATRTFLAGDTMTLAVHFEATNPVEEPNFGIAIYDLRGNHCFGTNTQLKRYKTGIVNGAGIMYFHLEHLPMLEGKFYISLAVQSADEKVTYHWLDRYLLFEVDNPSDDIGAFYIPVRVELKSPVSTNPGGFS